MYEEITTRSTTVVLDDSATTKLFFVLWLAMSKLDGGRANFSRPAAGDTDGSGRLGTRPISAQRRFMAGLSVPRAFIDMVFLLQWLAGVSTRAA